MILNVRLIYSGLFVDVFFCFFEGLRLVFVLLDHTGDINSLTQSLESFIVKQGLENMLKNKDTIKQVCLFICNQKKRKLFCVF
jgi:hypothetical protein